MREWGGGDGKNGEVCREPALGLRAHNHGRGAPRVMPIWTTTSSRRPDMKLDVPSRGST